MTSITLLAPNRTIKATALVIATRVGENGAVPVAGAERADDLLGGRLADTLTALGAAGREAEVIKIPVLDGDRVQLVVAVGLGDSDGDGLDPELVRQAVGTAMRALAGSGSAVISIGTTDDVATLAAVAEGAGLGAYAYHRYKTGPVTAPVARVQIRAASSAAARAVLTRAREVATAVVTVRDWVNVSPLDLYPESFAALATAHARAAGCTVQVLDERALRRGNYGGILGVGSGSARPPRLVRVSYRPAGAKTSVALIGKGITYDSGGYSLKIPSPQR